MSVSSDFFARRLADVAARVERTLDALLSRAPSPGETMRPPRLIDAMRHATLGGGKRLRAFLVIETASALGAGDSEGAMRAAAAVECLHAYSLAHDDLPAMDDDDLRRGRPTVHRAFDEATAILAGDALQTLAFAILSDPATHADAAVRADLVLTLASASGVGGMAGGQMLDLAAEGRFDAARSDLDVGDIKRIQQMKTGALIGASAAIGALIAGADANERAAMQRYAQAVGAAFQIADDILDLEASAETLGKATHKDDAKGKATLANALGLGRAKEIRDELVKDAIAALAPFGERAALLADAARFAGARRN